MSILTWIKNQLTTEPYKISVEKIYNDLGDSIVVVIVSENDFWGSVLKNFYVHQSKVGIEKGIKEAKIFVESLKKQDAFIKEMCK